jgi:DNA sulfur modification protein DndD
MKLASLEFKDWRQFEGTQRMEFSRSRERNLTVIYGTNGAAKTTTLNALLWVFYGPSQFTADFEQPENLINKSVKALAPTGSQLTCSVEVVFYHRGYRYRVRRSQTLTKDETPQRPRLTLELTLTKPDGNTEPIRVASSNDRDSYAAIQNELDLVLPSRLAHVFFFNGERFADKIATEQEAHDGETFADAIRHVLRLKEYERATEHIKRAIETLNRGINDPETEALRSSKLEEIKRADNHIQGLTTRFDELKKRLQENTAKKSEIDRQLLTDANLSELAVTRGKLEVEKSETLKSKKAAENALARFLGRAIPVFLIGFDDKILSLAGEHRERRHIPANFQEQFIVDLLNDKTCICGRELNEGSPHRHKIESLRAVGGLPEVTERWNVLNAKVKALSERLQDVRSSYKRQSEFIAECERKLDRLDIDITSKTEEMTRLGGAEITAAHVQELNDIRRVLDEQIAIDNKDLGGTESQLSEIRSTRDTLEEDLLKIEARSAQAKLDQRRCRLLMAVREQIISDLQSKTSEIVRELETETTRIFRSLAAKNFSAKLTSQLKLEIVDESATPIRQVALGTGERQAANYAFVSAVSSLAAKQGEPDEQDDGYPILVDAPFSVQEAQQRLRIARELPKHTHQLVLLMLANSAEPLREPDVAGYIGAEIVASLYTNVKSGFVSETISVGGRTYDYLIIDPSLPHPYTVLQQAVAPIS